MWSDIEFPRDEILKEHDTMLKTLFAFESDDSSPSESTNGRNVKFGSFQQSQYNLKSKYNDENVKISYKNKTSDEYLIRKLRCIQCIKFHIGAIYAMKFSHDGRYLCTGGQDKRVVVWCIDTCPPIHHKNGNDDDHSPRHHHHHHHHNHSDKNQTNSNAITTALSSSSSSSSRPITTTTTTTTTTNTMNTHDISIKSIEESNKSIGDASVHSFHPDDVLSIKNSHNINNTPQTINYTKKGYIQTTPYRVYEGHTGFIIDISWSSTDFILSASIDKSVCLWHIEQLICLGRYNHPDWVSSVDFHPIEERYFITGCFDKKVRVWEIRSEPAVTDWNQASDIVTAVKFTPDGKQVVGGLKNGQVYFYHYDGMKYHTQMNCRNTAGKYSNGAKISHLQFLPTSTINNINNNNNNSNNSNNALLVCTCDNSVRLYSTDNYSISHKYKGVSILGKQIKASCSEDGQYIISGSEDGKVYIWSKDPQDDHNLIRPYVHPKKSIFSSLFSSTAKTGTTTKKIKNHAYESFEPYKHNVIVTSTSTSNNNSNNSINNMGNTPNMVTNPSLGNTGNEKMNLNGNMKTTTAITTTATSGGTSSEIPATTVVLFGPSTTLIDKSVVYDIHSKYITDENRHVMISLIQQDLGTRMMIIADEDGRLTVCIRER